MKPVAELADCCIRKMPLEKHFSWANWWTEIVGEKEYPNNKTWAYHNIIYDRNRTKHHLNREFGRRQVAYRLVCLGHGKGLKLVGKNTVADETIKSGTQRIVSSYKTGIKAWMILSQASNLSLEDRKKLRRLGQFMELQESTAIGQLLRLRSLPESTKKLLKQTLGLDGKKKKSE